MIRLLLFALALAAMRLSALGVDTALSPPETLEQAAYAWRNGDGHNAELWLLNALEKDPQLGRAQLLLGLVYASAGRGDEAEERLKLAARQADLMSESSHNLGTLYFKNGRYHEARLAFERALLGNPERADSLQCLGILALKLEDWAAAEQWFERCLRVSQDNWQAWAGLGEALSSQGKSADAVAAWKEAQGQGGGDETRLKLAAAHFAAGDSEAASKNLDGLMRADSSQALYLAGCVASRLGKSEQALHAFEQAVHKDPGDTRALLALAVTRYDRREYEPALHALQQVLKSNPENIRAKDLRIQVIAAGVEDLLNEAGSAVVEGEIKQARHAAARAAGLDSGHAAARELLKSLDELAQSNAVTVDADRAAQAAQRQARAEHYAVLGARSFEMGFWTLAKEQLAQALRLGSQQPGLNDMLSQARGKVRLAMEGKAKPAPSPSAADPIKVRQLYLQGVYAYAGGDTQKAVAAWRKVLEVDPAHFQAKDAMEEAGRKMNAVERLKKKS